MNYTTEELQWMKVDLKHLHIGDVLEELNQRAKQYHGNSMSVKESQQQALQDFQTYIKDGEFVCLPENEVKEGKFQEHFRRASVR